MRKMLLAAVAVASLAFPSAAAAHEKYDHTVTSFDGTPIVISVYKPDKAATLKAIFTSRSRMRPDRRMTTISSETTVRMC